MMSFLKGLLLLVLLAALGTTGWFCWVFWQEAQRLDAEKSALEVERTLMRSDGELREAELKRVTLDCEALARKLASAQAACEKAQEQARQLRYEKENAVRALTAELESQKKLLVQARSTPPTPKAKPADGVEVESLRQLLDMTDRAPRRPSQRP